MKNPENNVIQPIYIDYLDDCWVAWQGNINQLPRINASECPALLLEYVINEYPNAQIVISSGAALIMNIPGMTNINDDHLMDMLLKVNVAK